MADLQDRDTLLGFLRRLRREGGYAEHASDSNPGLWSTVSVLKTLAWLDAPDDRASTAQFVRSCHEPRSGGFAEPGKPATVIHTALGLIADQILGQRDERVFDNALGYMEKHASGPRDFFMLLAVHDECAIPVPRDSAAVRYFETQVSEPRDAVELAMAASALVRARRRSSVPDSAQLVARIHAERNDRGWWDDDDSSLMATYVVMRLANLLELPLGDAAWELLEHRTRPDGGYSTTPKGAASALGTYQAVTIAQWLRRPAPIAVSSARCGYKPSLVEWLDAGGDPNVRNDAGWTPLLAASARGHGEIVRLLLDRGADPNLRFTEADALPIYMAGQSGDLDTIRALLARSPEHLDEVSTVNGHSLLLQLTFYGSERHRGAAKYVLDELAGDEEHRARLIAATNVRNLNAIQMARFWKNVPMVDLLEGYIEPESLEHLSAQHYRQLMLQIASPEQRATTLIDAIALSLESASSADASDASDASDDSLEKLREITNLSGFDIDARGGPLQQPPLVFAITGIDDGNEPRRRQRERIVRFLLDNGADPACTEKHPMGIGSVIRAAVLGRLDMLEILAKYMNPRDFADEMNVSPGVNGLTALHDCVHRALHAKADWPTRKAQLRFMVQRGARDDIADHTGQTQRDLAEAARHDPAISDDRVDAIVTALDSAQEIP